MIEIAVRVKELAASNLNHLVESAASPAKMLRLLVVELEEAILTLTRDATLAERRARDGEALALRHEAAAADWQEKARFAMSKAREDLARGALVERENAQAAALAARAAGTKAGADAPTLHAAIAELEAKLAETRARLKAEQAAAAAASPPPSGSDASPRPSRVEQTLDRIATLEKRLDFASEAAPSGKAASIDQELAALARDASVEAELDALRKAASKKKK